MKNLIKSGSIIIAVAAIVGGATYAYFSDQATSRNNTFSAGILDLTLQEQGSLPLTVSDMLPGYSTGEQCMKVKNSGTVAGWLGMNAVYAEKDNTATDPTVEMSADDVAKMMLVTSLRADTQDITTTIPDVDSDGRKTVYDITKDPNLKTPPKGGDKYHEYDANMAAGDEHVYCMNINFDENASNDYQGDGITLKFDFFLGQL